MTGLSLSQVFYGIGVLGIFYSIRLLNDFRRLKRSFGNHPGFRFMVRNSAAMSLLIPWKIPGFYIGRGWPWREKHKGLAKYGWDTVSFMAWFPSAFGSIITAEASVIKQITLSRSRFPKPVFYYLPLKLFGMNIVVTEDEEWKRHRKISAPAFSERNNKLVWDETVLIILDMFNYWAQKGDSVVVEHVVDITLPIALMVIGVAGFGRRIAWKDDAQVVIPPGHKMSFKDALHTVSDNIYLKVALPNWALGATQHTRYVRTAFEELRVYMIEMIAARKNAEQKEERYDLFSSLLDASESEKSDGVAALSDSELMGNVFVFLVAGHETTAHTLAWTFAMLALYPDEQEKLFQHINSVLHGRPPSYADMNSLTYSMAVFYETLRMFPPVLVIPKYSAEDTVLKSTNPDGTTTSIPCPKGTPISLNVGGLHYNPRYWEDPETFNPSRFLGDWPRDAFLPFSGGPRACIGRRFFETEGIATLTMLVSKYKIEVKEEPQFAGETFEERKARILKPKFGMTVAPVRTPLVFKRR